MQWASLIHRKQRMRIVVDIADQHYNTTVQKKFLQSLVMYTRNRHAKIADQGIDYIFYTRFSWFGFSVHYTN